MHPASTLVQRVRLASVNGQPVALPDGDHPGREPATVLRRQPLGSIAIDFVVAIHLPTRQCEVQQVGREAAPGRKVRGAQTAVVRLGTRSLAGPSKEAALPNAGAGEAVVRRTIMPAPARSTIQVNALLVSDPDPRLYRLLAGQEDLTDCRRTGLTRSTVACCVVSVSARSSGRTHGRREGPDKNGGFGAHAFTRLQRATSLASSEFPRTTRSWPDAIQLGGDWSTSYCAGCGRCCRPG